MEQPMDVDMHYMALSPSQQRAYNLIMARNNVFITGAAGTGKSALLTHVIRDLRASYGVDDSDNLISVVASTGVAASHIGGWTLHSWGGVGIGRESSDNMYNEVSRYPKVMQRWQQVGVLVIDEVSMLDGCFFDKLETLARRIRQDERPFGGIQLLICGDFAQLPPIPDAQVCNGEFRYCYAFEAESWKRCFLETVSLWEMFRQRDEEFLALLWAIRSGTLTREQSRQIQALSRRIEYADGVEATELYGRRDEASDANDRRLDRLEGQEYTYVAYDEPYDCPDHITQARLRLKLGAQVMLIRNYVVHRLPNGTVGRVVDFLTYDDASTTPDITILDPFIRALDADGYDSELETRVYVNGSEFRGRDRVWPVIQLPDGRKYLCFPAYFSTESRNWVGYRHQVPLILAWAITIHKSQGQTIDRLIIDLANVWAEGQVYVALSRGRDLESIEVRNFTMGKVRVNRRVAAYDQTIQYGTQR